MRKVCDHCGQPIQEAHKEAMDKTRLLMLKAAAQWVIDHNQNDFKKRDIGLEDMSISAYGNFGRLRYHALITPVQVNGNRVKGRWLITRQGWAFLRGEIEIPKFVLVRNNHIVLHSKQLVSVRDVYRGSEIMQTAFEYFDDEGYPVGVRPLLREDKQLTLI